MKTKWIAVVTRIEARIFSGKEFTLVTNLKNSIGRLRNRALLSGRPGLGHGKFSKGSAYYYSLTGEKDPHEDAAIAFSKRVAEYLRKQMNLGKFEHLVLVAEPRMLGRLKGRMEDRMLARMEVAPKDYGKMSVHELRKAVHV